MNCEQCQELMIEVLYGEEVLPRVSYDFFAHLGECRSCDREYVGLLETRDELASWKLDEDGPAAGVKVRDWRGIVRAGWPVLQRVAAAVLVAAGALFILQQAGFVNRPSVPVPEDLQKVVLGVVDSRQDETLRLIGEALLDIKEEIVLRDRASLDTVYEDIGSLEQRYRELLEENRQRARGLPIRLSQ